MYKGQTIGMLAWRLRLETDGVFTLRKALFPFLWRTTVYCYGRIWLLLDLDR